MNSNKRNGRKSYFLFFFQTDNLPKQHQSCIGNLHIYIVYTLFIIARSQLKSLKHLQGKCQTRKILYDYDIHLQMKISPFDHNKLTKRM